MLLEKRDDVAKSFAEALTNLNDSRNGFSQRTTAMMIPAARNHI
jgi:hypothetical protein